MPIFEISIFFISGAYNPAGWGNSIIDIKGMTPSEVDHGARMKSMRMILGEPRLYKVSEKLTTSLHCARLLKITWEISIKSLQSHIHNLLNIERIDFAASVDIGACDIAWIG